MWLRGPRALPAWVLLVRCQDPKRHDILAVPPPCAGPGGIKAARGRHLPRPQLRQQPAAGDLAWGSGAGALSAASGGGAGRSGRSWQDAECGTPDRRSVLLIDTARRSTGGLAKSASVAAAAGANAGAVTDSDEAGAAGAANAPAQAGLHAEDCMSFDPEFDSGSFPPRPHLACGMRQDLAAAHAGAGPSGGQMSSGEGVAGTADPFAWVPEESGPGEEAPSAASGQQAQPRMRPKTAQVWPVIQRLYA